MKKITDCLVRCLFEILPSSFFVREGSSLNQYRRQLFLHRLLSLFIGTRVAATAEYNRLVKKSSHSWRDHAKQSISPTGRKSRQSHISRISTKIPDLVPNPDKRRLHIQQGKITAVLFLCPVPKRRMAEIAKCSQTIFHGNDDSVCC